MSSRLDKVTPHFGATIFSIEIEMTDTRFIASAEAQGEARPSVLEPQACNTRQPHNVRLAVRFPPACVSQRPAFCNSRH